MGHFNRRNQRKRKSKKEIKNKTVRDVTNKIGEIILESKKFEEDIQILETPFGEILAHDGMLAHEFRNKGVLFEILTYNEEEEGDTLGRLIHFEKLKEKYPNEPYIAYEISECYLELKEWEKYDKLVKENYEKYRGYPFIDISYVMYNKDNYGDDVTDVVFGKELNIHQVYPTIKAFDSAVISDFYFTIGMIHKNRGEFATARNCAAVVKRLNKRKGLVLDTAIDFIEKPWLKWRTRVIMVFILLAILGLIGAIIWGIINLFQWIF